MRVDLVLEVGVGGYVRGQVLGLSEAGMMCKGLLPNDAPVRARDRRPRFLFSPCEGELGSVRGVTKMGDDCRTSGRGPWSSVLHGNLTEGRSAATGVFYRGLICSRMHAGTVVRAAIAQMRWAK